MSTDANSRCGIWFIPHGIVFVKEHAMRKIVRKSIAICKI